MATFRKRGGKWHAQVRRQGHPSLTRSFARKADAEAWAREREREIDRGAPLASPAVLRSLTFGDLLQRYERDVLPRKKCRDVEVYYIRTVCRLPLANTPLDKLNTSAFAAYRDKRLAEVSTSSVRREFSVLRHCLEVARTEWGVPLFANPLKGLALPPEPASRERRVTLGELESIARALARANNTVMASIIHMALATGMRRSEILKVTWGDVDLSRRLLHLRETKNGKPRYVPLGPVTLRVLQRLPIGAPEEKVFPLTANAVRLSWDRLKARCGIKGLTFHDLRHEAISRFFEAGLSVPEVGLISGHRDPRMLFRYTHLRPEAVAARLESLSARRPPVDAVDDEDEIAPKFWSPI